MSLLVVDASVALKWFLAEEGSGEADRLQAGHELIAPDIIVAELVNALWKAFQKKLAPVDQLERSVDALAEPFSKLVPSVLLAAQAWHVATTLHYPAYDAFYIALAEREGCELVTADRRLLQATAGTDFEKFVRPLESRA
ncbi:MAG TPA: type II toxin-antitoxin system VapC family toxin [Rhizomicrobium sp.]